MKLFNKILSIFMTAIIAVTCLCLNASAESIADTAKEIDSGKKISFTPEVKLLDADYKDYEVTLSKKGTLKLKIEAKSTAMCVRVMDENGKNIKPSKETETTGSIRYSSINAYSELNWNRTLEKFKGTLSYTLSKGTYYIRIWAPAHSDVYGKTSVSFTYPQSEKAEKTEGTISILTITMRTGDSIQLGTVTEGEGKVEWSSSEKSVVSVSSKGKLTAKGKGTATITAKLGKSIIKIQITVIE